MSEEAPVLLVVEDEADSRETLKELLELQGYRVATANNGREALEQLDLLGPHCIMLLDLSMPVMTGWEVVEQLRTDGRLASLRLLIMTSATHAAPAGLPVLGKPLELAKLLRSIEALR
jgi:CheY-like chemotaxis protein